MTQFSKRYHEDPQYRAVIQLLAEIVEAYLVEAGRPAEVVDLSSPYKQHSTDPQSRSISHVG